MIFGPCKFFICNIKIILCNQNMLGTENGVYNSIFIAITVQGRILIILLEEIIY